jgi:hypothetical protein
MNSQRLEPQPSDNWESRQKRLDLVVRALLIVGLANLVAGLTFLVLALSR